MDDGYEALNGAPGSHVAKSKGFWWNIFGSQKGRPDGRWVPEEEASFLSRISFWWVGSLISLGNQKSLTAQDLWDVAYQDSTLRIASKIESAWTEECGKPRPSLARALWSSFGLKFALAGILKLMQDILQFSSPVFLKLIVEYLQNPGGSKGYGLLLAGLLLCCNLTQSVCVQNYFHIVYRTSVHVRAAVISVVYRKALRISASSRQTTSLGQIVNLQSNDAEKLASLCIYLHIIWSGPLQIFGALGLLFGVIGVIPALCGLGVMVLIMPVSAAMMRLLTNVRKRLIAATDARVKLVSEVINGIKAIKLYAWEEPFRERVDELRDAEMKEIKTTVLLDSFTYLLYYLTPIAVSVVSLGAYVLLSNKPLTASVAFPALALFNLLRFPLFMIPNQISSFAQAGVSISRLEKFLELPETTGVDSKPGNAPGTIEICNGSFIWKVEGGEEIEGKDKEEGKEEEKKEEEDTLKDINLVVTPGQLLIVIGEVGAGKSSILAAMLGEIRKTGGSVFVNGSLAYTAQDPWIQNATLRDNILMGEAMDEEKYERVLNVCALRDDLKTLPGGDLSEIGEKGINLSGGQKHRVSLARAVYASADVYLLDDPLSAVDTHVGRHLFDECINGELKGATRVLVTHQLQYVEAADAIAVVKNGRIQEYGSYEELLAKGIDFAVFQEKEEPKEATGEGAGDNGKLPTNGMVPPVPSSKPKQAEVVEEKEEEEDLTDAAPLLSKKKSKEDVMEAKRKENAGGSSSLVQQEFRAIGKVKGSVYLAYFRAWGGLKFLMPFLVLLAFVISQAAKLGNDTWLAVWTQGVEDDEKKGGVDPMEQLRYYMGIYCLTAVASGLTSYVRNLLLVYSSLSASRKLHAQLLTVTLRLPMSFFDSQPTGRLLNRFTRDTEQVDLNLPDTLLSYLICLFQVVFAVGIIVYVTPFFAIPLIPLLLVYRAVQKFYIAASRELKRIDSVARSPIFAHFGESVAGIATLRAFKRQSNFTEMNNRRVDDSTRAYFTSTASNRWLGMRLEVLGSLCVFATALFCVTSDNLSSGFAGLALANALTITGYMNWMVRMNAELETQMNSVERLLEYADLETEAPAIVESHRPPSAWPTRGSVEAFDLVVRYRADLDPVLKGLTFCVLGGEKVGICGRTGCGKSTLMMTLYRIMEMDSGLLLIDGVDISKIGLRDLRSRLALVPQDPVVFSGTIRLNLDPFREASGDSELWEALRRSGMSAVVESLPGKLDAEVAEGGSNFSTGQRQLLCMARALLRHAKILVLDEATSNVDSSTDAIIQTTIREAFADCTVLTIAHRLHTIIDSDRVMLLDDGRLAEFDSPADLLADDSSRFTGFVNQTLPKEAAALRRVASSQKSLSRLSLMH